MAESVQERLKLKRTVLDTWSTREKLSLASLVLRSGDQNWSCVSRNIRLFAEPNRPPDWFSPKNCAQQYASLLENVETPKRKKRVAGSNEKSEVETPGESIVRKLKTDRVEELKNKMDEIRMEYLKVKASSNAIISGDAENKLPALLHDIEDEKKKKELEKEAHIKWLKEREERKIELERAWKPGSRLMNIRRASSMSEPSSEADSPLSEPLNVDVPEDTNMAKPTPTSPLLTSLLKSPSTVSQPSSQTTSSILHSAITSPHRGSSPTIASLLSSSPGLPGNFLMPPSNVSSNLKNLVSNAIANSFGEEPKVHATSPSQGAPTLSMLLELPPSLPGKPLPMLKPQPSSPPPYSEHLGPPPPYSQATEYLQKQRAEELAAQNQAKAKAMEEEIKSGTTPSSDVNSMTSTPPSSTAGQSLSTRRTSLKGRGLDLPMESETEQVVQDTSSNSSPLKERDTKRIHHNTSDHDYVEMAVKEREGNSEKLDSTTPKKTGTDVFEFDELKEGYDKIDLMVKDSKMSYLKSNVQRGSVKKEGDANNQRRNDTTTNSSDASESLKVSHTESEKTITTRAEEEDTKKRDGTTGQTHQNDKQPEPSIKSPAKVPDHKRSSRASDDSNEALRRRVSGEEDNKSKKDADAEDDKLSDGQNGEQSSEPANSDFEENKRRKSEDVGEQSEEEKMEGDADGNKDEDSNLHILDTNKSEKAELSTTEDEKSNDATPRVYSRRRGGPSFSDSVPNSPAPLTEEEKEHKLWKKAVMLVYTRIAGHKYASLFLKPISDDQAPEYSSIVRRPMDLSTIKRNIEMGNIRTTAEFQRDVMLMFMNALMYNERDHHVYRMAKEMQADSLEHFQMLLRVADENTPLRRETRTQQNAEVKFRSSDKSQPKGGKATVPEADKSLTASPEVKQRGRMKNSPCPLGRPRNSEKPVVSGRKRTTLSTSDATKKRMKVDD
ncbi:hypothetical protein RUM43_000902 [Polyplax serrata]|uniref:Bromo domain-containing protein n=1 Tax=Polyplax serrata TaxID=468196 RepID=A0AAN8XPC5_POLSC